MENSGGKYSSCASTLTCQDLTNNEQYGTIPFDILKLIGFTISLISQSMNSKVRSQVTLQNFLFLIFSN